MSRVWIKDGRIVTDAAGRVLLCDECPCAEETGTGTGTGTITPVVFQCDACDPAGRSLPQELFVTITDAKIIDTVLGLPVGDCTCLVGLTIPVRLGIGLPGVGLNGYRGIIAACDCWVGVDLYCLDTGGGDFLWQGRWYFLTGPDYADRCGFDNTCVEDNAGPPSTTPCDPVMMSFTTDICFTEPEVSTSLDTPACPDGCPPCGLSFAGAGVTGTGTYEGWGLNIKFVATE